MHEIYGTPVAADDSSGAADPFGFAGDDDSWIERLRQSEAPLPYGCAGAYELIEEVSRGGQGIVYRARHTVTQRPAAVKRLLAGSFATPGDAAEIEREIEALAALDHPNIVAAFAMDESAGTPLLAMEWVEGVPITKWAVHPDGRRRDADESVRLMLKVCDAVQHAHQRGLIHRDLKPSNVLVEEIGIKGSRDQGVEGSESGAESAPLDPRRLGPSDPVPKILDFGLARPLCDDPRGTVTDQFVGTLAYASPEQLRGRPGDVDARSDGYSLGVILYEMLTGRGPYDLGDGLAAATQAIERTEPIRPSSINPKVGRDLEAVVLKALAKQPRLRYQSADALAADLRHYLAREPVSARAPGGLTVLWSLFRRHRLAATFALTVVVLVCGAAIVASVLAGRLAHQRNVAVVALERAEREEARARAVTDFLHDMLISADPMRASGHELTVREALDQASARVDAGVGDDPQVEAAVRLTLGTTYHSLGLHDAAAPHLREALRLYQAQEAGDHSDVARATNELGHLLTSRGDYAGAESLLREGLRMRRALFGADHRDVAGSLNNLAKLLHQKGEYDAAHPLWIEALEIRRRILGDEHHDVASSLCNLAGSFHIRKDYGSAEPMYREVLALDRRLLGSKHSDVSDVLNNLGVLLRTTGRLDEAEAMIRESLEIRREVLDARHPNVAHSLASLGQVFDAKGEHAAAESLHRESLAIRRERLGDEHPDTAHGMTCLGRCLTALGRADEAEPLLTRAYELLHSRLGAAHSRTQKAVEGLVEVYERLGRPEEAARFRARLSPAETSDRKPG